MPRKNSEYPIWDKFENGWFRNPVKHHFRRKTKDERQKLTDDSSSNGSCSDESTYHRSDRSMSVDANGGDVFSTDSYSSHGNDTTVDESHFV